MAGRCWVLLAGAAVLASCGSGANAAEAAEPSTVFVFAASSLSDVFAEMETAFEDENPRVDIQLSLAGSSALREQILDGAPADVFASANSATTNTVIDAGLATDSVVFARNRLQIAVGVGNPAEVQGLDAFARDELLLGICAQGVPCGDLARQALENAEIVPSLDTEEPNVRALLSKVASGDLDAAIVYATDIATSDDVEGVELPDSVNVTNEYTIALMDSATDRSASVAFIEFVLSDAGVDILGRHGFETP